jgi:signal transduction histidine kinase
VRRPGYLAAELRKTRQRLPGDLHDTEHVPHPRVLVVTGGALLSAGALVATWSPAVDDANRAITSLSAGRLQLVVLVAIFGAAALGPLGILAWADKPLGAVGLTVGATAAVLPLWAGSSSLDARWRAWSLAFAPLAVAGFALMTRTRIGAVVAAAAAVLHALAYDPFRDIGCARVCLQVPAVVTMTTSRLSLVVAVGSAVAAALTVAGAWSGGWRYLAPAAGALALAGLSVVRWRTVGDAEVYADLQLLAVPVPGLVALPALVGWARTVRRRSAVRRLADHLSEDPDGLIELAGRVDVSLLSAGQQLALRNARLAAESRARMAEVRASQRRVVAAADAERRRIERDLHDGTQQRLVGVLMQLSGRGHSVVEEQIREVLADLRSFSRDTFPPVLEEEGLAIALGELAATSDADLRLHLQLDGTVPPEQGRAVYALVSRVTSGSVEVSVVSRGSAIHVSLVGCPPVDLGDVHDRFGALGGNLTILDGRIEGSLPCVW